jgi:hypothetical protein
MRTAARTHALLSTRDIRFGVAGGIIVTLGVVDLNRRPEELDEPPRRGIVNSRQVRLQDHPWVGRVLVAPSRKTIGAVCGLQVATSPVHLPRNKRSVQNDLDVPRKRI